jgi:hypothetical protein
VGFNRAAWKMGVEHQPFRVKELAKKYPEELEKNNFDSCTIRHLKELNRSRMPAALTPGQSKASYIHI